MDRLQVDGAQLESLASTMAHVVSLLDNDISAYKGREDIIGDAGVCDALAGFERHWGDGRTRLRRKAEDFGSILSDAVGSYNDADYQVADALSTESVPTTRGAGAV